MAYRDTVVYQLKQGNQVVYIGITNDPARREKQHRKSGKEFDQMELVSQYMTAEEAQKKEQEMLEKYRKGHGGKNPKYNDDPNG